MRSRCRSSPARGGSDCSICRRSAFTDCIIARAAQLFDFYPKLHYTTIVMQQKSSRDSTQSETMTKAVGAALVPETLVQSPPAVEVGAGFVVG